MSDTERKKLSGGTAARGDGQIESQSLARLPSYLRKYCATQNYAGYTARDQASWRFIMRQSRAFFRDHAVPIYVEGLSQSGIPMERIPRIDEMDEALRKFGWGAVAVRGFIPPAAFLEFQARAILPIATDMRTVEHIAYTPAPDIVHEAAGHAPVIADPDYRAYLRRYADMAEKAITSKEDLDVYEAIRYLSDIKENPTTPASEIERAQQRLDAAGKAASHVTEATLVSRLYWWTVEYGLVGDTRNPLIYGAGLLSSVGESQHCLSPAVKKIPLTVACVEQGYDITRQQPQLFVARSMDSLTGVLETLEKTMAFVQGGREGAEKARRAGAVSTLVLESGVSASGRLESFETDGAEGPSGVAFFKLGGPVQLAFAGQRREAKELEGQGRKRHPDGFSSPLGRWQGASGKAPHLLTDDELSRIGIRSGARCTLTLTTGFTIEGKVARLYRHDGHLLYVTWQDAKVTRGGKVYYEPSWGDFDMVVGERVVSVYGGPAAKDDYGDYNMGKASTSPGRTDPYTASDLSLFELYGKLREARSSLTGKAGDTVKKDGSDAVTLVDGVASAYLKSHPREWLLGLELVELAAAKKQETAHFPWAKDVKANLEALGPSLDESTRGLLQKGLGLVSKGEA